MIKITDKQLCCGCSACQQRCPKQCISMQQDNEGFLYPAVDVDNCIDCGLCDKVCHELHPYNQRKPLKVLAAINTNETIRLESSSGGIFTLLAEPIIQVGGVVFGARFDENWQVKLDYTETIEGLASFRGSKYVQSRTEKTYIQCEKFLKAGRQVLFTGTPCQVAGLHHFLRKPYDNLITVDFVCHGVPSPKVWGMYLCEVVGNANKAIQDVNFRNKDNGWKKFNFKIAYNKDSDILTLSSCHKQNHYMRAFLSDMILRPSCHNCKAKHGSSMSDLTIADFWGIHITHPEMDDDKGTGLVMINTEKGKEALDLTQCVYTETSISEATSQNAGLGHITKPHPRRDIFFKRLDSTHSVCGLIDKQLLPSLRKRLRAKFGKVKHLILSVLQGGRAADL